jgi:protein-S-isoprenylcysteine O-methyltransferase Ste14
VNASPIARFLFILFMIVAAVWRMWDFQKQGRDRGSVSMLWSLYGLVGLGVIVFCGTVVEFFLVPRPFHPAIAVLGAALLVAAGAIRVTAIRTLGRFWSLHIEIRAEQQLVREGIYRYLRHPAYSSFVLEIVAIPLVGNAWWSLGVAVVGYLPLLVWRLKREEEALCEKFGDQYRAYQREVGALWPRVSSMRDAEARPRDI